MPVPMNGSRLGITRRPPDVSAKPFAANAPKPAAVSDAPVTNRPRESVRGPAAARSNFENASISGTSTAKKLAIQIGAMVIAFVGIVYLLDGILKSVGLSLDRLFGYIFYPFAILLGVFRIIKGHPIHYYIITGYLAVVSVTFLAPQEIIGLAYDLGGVTTSTVTVPLVAALGIGLSSSIKGRNPAIDGFGLIAFASLTPMIFVQIYGIIVYNLGEASTVAPIVAEVVEGTKAVASSDPTERPETVFPKPVLFISLSLSSPYCCAM